MRRPRISPRDYRWRPDHTPWQARAYAIPLDEEDYDFLDYIRLHGRLPGAGTLQAWNVQDIRAPLIEAEDVAIATTRKAEKHSRAAYRAKSTYFNEVELSRLHEVWRLNDAARELELAKDKARILKHAHDQRLREEALERERKAWRNELRRWMDRRERWMAEQELWDDIEREDKHREQKAKEAAEHSRRHAILVQEIQAERAAAREAAAARTAEARKAADERYQARKAAEFLKYHEDMAARREANRELFREVSMRRAKILARVRATVEARCHEADIDDMETARVLAQVMNAAERTLDQIPAQFWETLDWSLW